LLTHGELRGGLTTGIVEDYILSGRRYIGDRNE
jgi:hypothetical protein